MESLIPVERIERRIYLIRGQKVMLDSDLAALYGVSTARLNQQVRRNIERFPPDFMFTLNMEEHARLMLQIATSNTGRGGRRKLPLVFTEQGVAMLSSALNSGQSIQVNKDGTPDMTRTSKPSSPPSANFKTPRGNRRNGSGFSLDRYLHPLARPAHARYNGRMASILIVDDEAFNAGADGYIMKPLEFAVVLGKVAKVLATPRA